MPPLIAEGHLTGYALSTSTDCSRATRSDSLEAANSDATRAVKECNKFESELSSPRARHHRSQFLASVDFAPGSTASPLTHDQQSLTCLLPCPFCLGALERPAVGGQRLAATYNSGSSVTEPSPGRTPALMTNPPPTQSSWTAWI